MSNNADLDKSPYSQNIIYKIIPALMTGSVLFICLIVLALAGFNVVYQERIYPGISVGGVDISGMRSDEASLLLSQELNYAENGRIVFKLDEKMWLASPRALGFSLDTDTSIEAAFSAGRQGNIYDRQLTKFNNWHQGLDLPLLYIYDKGISDQFLRGIAEKINEPAIEASLEIEGTDVIARDGKIGRALDVQSTLTDLESQLRGLSDSVISLKMKEQYPEILDSGAQAEMARRILSERLLLEIPDASENDGGPWVIDRETLAQMLKIEKVNTLAGAEYQVGFDEEFLLLYLAEIVPDVSREAADARFIFNDDTRQLDLVQSAVIGRELDMEASLQTIRERANEGEHSIFLEVEYTHPRVTDDVTAQELGIQELVSAESSFFYGSSAARIQNIKTASSRFHGVLVPPGETFSMASVLGDVSLDNGYEEALIIFGNRTIKGVGGGVCQVSTTLFRTVFFSGFPVEERHPHAYRVYYYELTPSGSVNQKLAGLDATVYVPVVDFRFTNDTPNWLLMETYVNVSARSLTWKFYSTSDDRIVDWDTTGLQNIVEPPEPLYVENPDLEKGEIKQTDWEVEGADVSILRTVTRGGQVYFQDEFNTHYLPWGAVYEYGPGTKIPKDKKKDN